jgi:pimeloyl-ACP methyl ester carboxylesterase
MGIVSISALVTASALAATPAPLPRLAPLNAVYKAPPAGSEGVAIAKVNAGGTAAALGMREEDVVNAIDGRPIRSPKELQAATARKRAGDPLQAAVLRGGKAVNLRGKAVGLARETFDGTTVEYRAVPFRGGKLSSIFVQPAGRPNAPILYFIQGYTCGTIDSPGPNDYHRKIVGALLARGIAVYRIEKTGVGDSVDTPDCATSDFQTELDGFAAGYQDVLRRAGGDAGRIFILGHSMGGLEAPLIAAKADKPPRGVAVYGTVLKPWADWAIGAAAFQPFDYTGADPGVGEAEAVRLRPLIHEFYHGPRSPTQIAADGPEQEKALREMGWQGGDVFLARSMSFWRQVATLPLAAAWRDTRSRVLSLFGESDAVTMSADDHIRIAAIANWYRPGSATFITIPETDHLMLKVGTPDEFRRRNQAKPGANSPAPFNLAVSNAVADWIERSMTLPPVAATPSTPR